MTLCCYDCGYVKRIQVVRLSALRSVAAEHGVKCLVRLRDMARAMPSLRELPARKRADDGQGEAKA